MTRQDAIAALREQAAALKALGATGRRSMTQNPAKTGGVLAALRRSPLVGADLAFERPRVEGRKVSM